jgi:hypothetical protein
LARPTSGLHPVAKQSFTKKASQYKASQRESFSARKLLKVSEKASQRPKASQRESFSKTKKLPSEKASQTKASQREIFFVVAVTSSTVPTQFP